MTRLFKVIKDFHESLEDDYKRHKEKWVMTHTLYAISDDLQVIDSMRDIFSFDDLNFDDLN